MSFENRIFLLETEYETYMRRMPVRYIRHPVSKVCAVCGQEGTAENPIQKAHLIPFNSGIKEFKLTPDFLDRRENIVAAHRNFCNKKAEMSEQAISEFVYQLKENPPKRVIPGWKV